MAKAWRNENARKINQRRAAGSKEGTARQQTRMAHSMTQVKTAGNWLLDGLLIRGGYVPVGIPSTDTHVPVTEGMAKRISRTVLQWWARKG